MPIIRVRLNEDLYKMLVEISRKENKSISDVVRDAIRFYHEYRDAIIITITEEQLKRYNELIQQGFSPVEASKKVVEEVREGKIR